MKLSCVEPHASQKDTYFVKACKTSTVFCLVRIKTPVKWKGKLYHPLTGTCPYSLSSRMICPCGCAAAQRAGIDINDYSLVHPCWHISNHPLWPDALSSVGLCDYPDSDQYSDTALVPVSDLPTSEIARDDVRRITTQVYDSLGDMKHLSISQRVTTFRQSCAELEKIA